MTFKLVDFLPYQLSVASNAVSRAVAQGSDYELRFGLSATQWRVLAAVTASGSATQTQVVTITAMDKMSVSRALAALQRRHRVLKRADPQDARRSLLELSAAGRRLFETIGAAAMEREQRLFAGLSANQRAQLATMVDRLAQALQAA